MLGAIEAGGTKFVCGVGDIENVVDRVRLPTTQPDETLAAVEAFFDQHEVEALGIGSFGPIDRDRRSSTWGRILPTPKVGWSNTPFGDRLADRYGVPVEFETDVSAAALVESRLGVRSENLVYMTVGTGIGMGVVSNGQIVSGAGHPEAGHIGVQRHPDDVFAGSCPFHGDCLEGLASGPALEQRWGRRGEDGLPDQAWEFEAWYLAQAVTNLIYTLGCDRIVIGGGVGLRPRLHGAVAEHAENMMAGYVASAVFKDLTQVVVPPAYGADAGLVGSFMLAEAALQRS